MTSDYKCRNFILFIFICSTLYCIYALEGPKLTILSIAEHEIHVTWSALNDSSMTVEKYQVSAYPTKSYGPLDKINRNEWTFSNSTTRSELMGLHPGTLYNISVWAYTSKGITEPTTEHIWTEVGSPDDPPAVEVLDRDGSTMTVLLPAGSSNNGPITGYQVITLEKTPITFFTREELGNFHQSQETGVPYYITADLTPEEANRTFIVGDKKMYGDYYNAPLLEDRDYEVLAGVVSSLNGVTKVSYSSLQSTESSHKDADLFKKARTSSALSVTLSAAIGVFGFLLVCSVIAYFLLRKQYDARRSSDELILRVHGSDGEENGFLPGALHFDSDADLSEFYEQLKERYWQIPRKLVELDDEVIGMGRFGEIRLGMINRHSETVNALLQLTEAPCMIKKIEDKRNLLRSLDAMSRIGIHPNVTEFIGASDEAGILLTACEHHHLALRTVLIDSRDSGKGKISTLSEHQLLELCVGVARGMAHLADRGIVHRRLTTRNVLIANNYIPKVALFGMSYYSPMETKLMYSRWAAPEVLKSRAYTALSDVWSFGVLLWEVFNLGGSPFVGISPKELLPRLTQGLRLSKPITVSEDLYQVMLHCWELDPDERPKFLELASILQNYFLNAKHYVHLRGSAHDLEYPYPSAEED